MKRFPRKAQEGPLQGLQRKNGFLFRCAAAELVKFGDPLREVKGNTGALLLHFFSKFARNFQVTFGRQVSARRTATHSTPLCRVLKLSFLRVPLLQDAIDGKLPSHQNSENLLMGGARINYIFHDWFGRALADFDPLQGLSETEIRAAIRCDLFASRIRKGLNCHCSICLLYLLV